MDTLTKYQQLTLTAFANAERGKLCLVDAPSGHGQTHLAVIFIRAVLQPNRTASVGCSSRRQAAKFIERIASACSVDEILQRTTEMIRLTRGRIVYARPWKNLCVSDNNDIVLIDGYPARDDIAELQQIITERILPMLERIRFVWFGSSDARNDRYPSWWPRDVDSRPRAPPLEVLASMGLQPSAPVDDQLDTSWAAWVIEIKITS